MAFCGQCGLLLNTNITKCPRCGTATDVDVATPGAPADDNSATIIAHANNPQPGGASYTPVPLAPGGNTYPEQRAPQYGHSQSNNSYPTPGAFQQSFPQSYMTPSAPAHNQAPGMYQPGVFPGTDPGYSTPPRKTRKWPIILVIVLIVALVAVTVMFFALGSNPFAGIFGPQNTLTVQVTPTAQPAATTVPTTQPSSTPPTTTTTTVPTQPAQATIQQYYTDINTHDYQDAFNLWVSYPDTYNNYKQGFAHTQRDDITFGEAIPQTDGTVQVNVTLQATENTAGGGTKITTYQGYYTVGQQADGSWKIINGQLA